MGGRDKGIVVSPRRRKSNQLGFLPQGISRENIYIYEKGERQQIQVRWSQHQDSKAIMDSITFYFTNVLENITHSEICKGFKVCDMLIDVFLTHKKNKRGQQFDFVMCTNVRDEEKMVQTCGLGHEKLGKRCHDSKGR